MPGSRRRLVIAAAVGAIVAAASVVTVLALARDEPDVDGEFVLDQPGIYAEPITTVDPTGEALPEIDLTDAEGAVQSLAEFAGRPMVVNIWYSTCVPCARELRDFAEVSGEQAGYVQFVGVNPRDDVESMVEFADARGVDYPLLRDSDQEFVTALGVAAYPTTLFVSADGQIVRQTNAIDADQLRSAIDELF